MTEFAFEPLYGSILFAAICCVAVVAVIIIVTPPTQNSIHRRWLIVLRSAAALLLLLTALRPSLIRTDNKPAEATLIVAADVSRSMTLTDGDGGDRWTAQRRAWQQLSQGVAKLDNALEVQLLVYDQDVKQISNPSAVALDSLSPDGKLTDLSLAAARAIQAAAGKPIVGVVFMGDGTQTAQVVQDTNTSAGAQRSVETLNALGVPFWPVPIGPAAGTASLRDVAIDALPESYSLFAGNEFDVSFQLQARGVAGIEVPVQLTWIPLDGKESEAAERTFVAQKSSDVAGFTIPLTAPEPGSYRLQVAAAQQSGELVTINNSQTAFVQVREGGGRILYLEGDHRQEQTFLNRALRWFPDLDLTFKSLRRDRTWPVDLDDWFAPGKFDIYILGDVDSAALGDGQLGDLANRVSDGAGLVMLGGYQTYDAGGYGTSPLDPAIPVKMNAKPNRQPNANDRTDQLPGPLVVEIARSHPINNLGDDSQSIWKGLPPQKGANRFVGAKVAPGIQILLQTPKKQPLMIVGEYGRGRTAAIGFDSTWTWWRAKKSETHRRFWRQVMLWLLAREDTAGDKITIDLDSRRFAIEDPPEFRARIQSLGVQNPSIGLVAEVIDANGKVLDVKTTQSVTNGTPSLLGKLPAMAAGFYTLRVRPNDANSSTQPGEIAFQAIDASREMARPMADPVYLKQLADLTAGHGGRAFLPDEMNALVDTIANRRQKAESPVVEKHRLGDGPMSGWIVFTLFATALCLEWYLRRQWGMA